MIHQIALWQNIPALREHLRGFIEETTSRLMDCQQKEYSLKSKYGNRLKRAQETLTALAALQRCLDE